MIEPQELRIGNYIQSVDGNFGKVNAIAKTYLQLENRQTFTYNDIRGVPLTEEWLLRLNFTIEKKTGRCWNKMLYGRFEDSVFILDAFFIKIQSVHAMQNLYFALYGEELPGISRV